MCGIEQIGEVVHKIISVNSTLLLRVVDIEILVECAHVFFKLQVTVVAVVLLVLQKFVDEHLFGGY